MQWSQDHGQALGVSTRIRIDVARGASQYSSQGGAADRPLICHHHECFGSARILLAVTGQLGGDQATSGNEVLSGAL
jgi:hypothetical protein